MEVFRLTRAKRAYELTGIGASLYGARWNSIGTPIIYTGINRSLVMAETAVHLSFAILPDDFFMMTIFIPDGISIEVVNDEDLPLQWNNYPPVQDTKKFGDDFVLDNRSCLLKVPSAVTQGDSNILINPMHKEFKKIKIIESVPFPFDSRLFKSL